MSNLFEATLSLITSQNAEAKAKVEAKKIEEEKAKKEFEDLQKLKADALRSDRLEELETLLSAKEGVKYSLEAAAAEKRVNDALDKINKDLIGMLHDAEAAGLLPAQLKAARETTREKQKNVLDVLRHHKMIG